MPKNSIFGRERHKVDTKLTHDLSWEDRDAIDGWTISESFVSTIVGGHPVKIRLEDKLAQKNGTSLTLDRLRQSSSEKSDKEML